MVILDMALVYVDFVMDCWLERTVHIRPRSKKAEPPEHQRRVSRRSWFEYKKENSSSLWAILFK